MQSGRSSHGLSASSRSFTRSGADICDPSGLLAGVCELADRLESNRTELLNLRHKLQTVPPASPELFALANEGGILEQRAREGAALVARLRTENAAAAWSVDCDRQRIRSLQKDRQRLLQELGSLEQKERELLESAREADRELLLEKRQAEERTFGQETALGIIASRATSAEQRWKDAEANSSKLRISAAEAESASATTSRIAAADVDRYSIEIRELQKALAHGNQTPHMLQSSESGESRSQLNHMVQRMQREEASCAELRRVQQILSAQVEDSRLKQAETEKRALHVARELVDSSQAIAWLQNEVAVQREAWAELDALRSHNDLLRQQVQVQNTSTDRDFVTETPDRQSQSVEQPELRAVSEALQLAWEGEAKGHRKAQQQLQSLEILCLTPARQQLLQFAGLSKQWRHCLSRWRSAGRENDQISQSAKEPTLSPGTEEELRHSVSVPAAHDVCGCIESLARETVHQLVLARNSVDERPGTAWHEQWADTDRGRGPRVPAGQIQALETEVEDSDAPSLTSSSLSLPLREAMYSRSKLRQGRAYSSHASHVPTVPMPLRGSEPIAGTAGPLYRLEATSPHVRSVRRNSAGHSRLSLDLEDRFDEYSVHRPRQAGV